MISKLTHHYEERLGAPDGALVDGAAHMIVSRRRSEPDETGRCVPFWALSVEHSLLISVSPEVAAVLPLNLSNFTFESMRERELRRELREKIESVTTLQRMEYEWEIYCTPERFQPVVSTHVQPVDELDIGPEVTLNEAVREKLNHAIRDDRCFGFFHASKLPAFSWIVASGRHAANIFIYPPDGGADTVYAEAVVSAAVSRIVQDEQVPVMNVPRDNTTVLRLANALGFRMFGQSLVAVSTPAGPWQI